MAIFRGDGHDCDYVLTCDECSVEEEIEGEFEDAVLFAKDEGWFLTKDKRMLKWLNYCPDCKDKFMHKHFMPPANPRT